MRKAKIYIPYWTTNKIDFLLYVFSDGFVAGESSERGQSEAI